MSEAEDRQLVLEMDSFTDGVKRVREKREQARLSHTSAGTKIIKTLVDPLTDAVLLAQDAIEGGETRAEGMALLSLPADFLAVITLHGIVNAVSLKKRYRPIPLLRLARDIGVWCAVEYKRSYLRGRELNLLERWIKRNRNPWNALRLAKKKIKTFRRADWQKKGWDVKLGSLLVDLAILKTGLLRKEEPPGEPIIVHLTENAQQHIADLLTVDDCFATPHHLPMIEPPLPWNTAESGGYKSLRVHLVKHHNHPTNLRLLKRADLRRVAEAVNALQETQWRINTFVYDVFSTAWEKKDPPDALRMPEPDPEEALPHDDEDEEELKENEQAVSNAVLIRQKLAIAKKFKDEPALYFPPQLDRRGREYPIPHFVHPQADDQGRALLMFARPKPLGERGAHWLAVYVANLYGEVDKEPYEKRVQWVHEHRDAIVDSVERPFDGTRFWKDADKPLRFLAAAKEWVGYLREGPGYLSCLPLALDATCNGLQHFSALGRDPEGGRWTNLIPGSAPEDIYRVVARLLKEEMVDPLAAAGDPIGKLWQGKNVIDRKLVKPATMTTPYGVTEVGIKRQLKTYIDENLKGRFPKAWTAATWLAPRLQLVIGSVVVKAVKIMEWLREIADLMADANRGLVWMTPIGLPVVQERRKPKECRIPTLAHSFVNYEHDPKGDIDSVAQQNGIVANVVHSLDASHMMLTVRALHARGIRDYSMVHDSYAVHACDVDVMNEVLRDTFVAMHEQFTLAHLVEQFRRIAPKKVARCPIHPRRAR